MSARAARLAGVALFLAVLAAGGTAEAQGYRTAAYLMAWNGGSSGGAAMGAVLESVMVDIFLSEMGTSYDHVVTCKGADCTQDRILDGVEELLGEYQAVDLYLTTHGTNEMFSVESGVVMSGELAAKRTTWDRRHRLRAVYQMNCYGASMNDDFLNLGFDVAMGTREVNTVGWIHLPLFLRFWKHQPCLFGGDCSRSFGDAVAMARGPASFVQVFADVFTELFQHIPAQDLDSTPVVDGDGSIRVTQLDGIYNACNGHGDAYGFLTPRDVCCLPGETCERQTYACDGAGPPVEPVDAALCPGPGGGADFALDCTTGADCPSGLCLSGGAGMRCAVPCVADAGCAADERCVETTDGQGTARGRFCDRPASREALACQCAALLEAGCAPAEGSAECLGRNDLECANAPPPNLDLTILSPAAPPPNLLAVCGCPVSPELAAAWCDFDAAPPAGGTGGCAVAGARADGAAAPAALLLALVALLSRRRRRRLASGGPAAEGVVDGDSGDPMTIREVLREDP